MAPAASRSAETSEAFFARPPGQKSSHSSERLLRDRARLHSASLFTCRDATMAMQLLSERPQDTLFRVPLEAHLRSAVCLSLNSPLCLYFCTHRAPLQGATEVVSRFMPLCLTAHRDPPPPHVCPGSLYPAAEGLPGVGDHVGRYSQRRPTEPAPAGAGEEGRQMKTADRSKQNLTASGQVPGEGKHLQAFAAVTFEKVNSACALKLRA